MTRTSWNNLEIIIVIIIILMRWHLVAELAFSGLSVPSTNDAVHVIHYANKGHRLSVPMQANVPAVIARLLFLPRQLHKGTLLPMEVSRRTHRARGSLSQINCPWKDYS